MCRSAVTGDTYDVGPRPPRPSLYRSTSARPPRDSICQLVSGTRLTPGPRSGTTGADRLSLSLSSPLFLSRPTILARLSFSYTPPRSESLEAPIPVGGPSTSLDALLSSSKHASPCRSRTFSAYSRVGKRGATGRGESAPVITALVQGAAVTDVGPYPITRDREPLVTPAERSSN